jgi:hypothetical protein
MSINAIKLYSEPKINNGDYNNNSIQTLKNKHSADVETSIKDNNTNLQKNNTVTKKERDFFKNMFPDNSEQIENYVLFTRNGKLRSGNLPKGVLIDEKA